MKGDDDFGMRDPRILIGEATRLADPHLVRRKLIDPPEHNIGAGRVSGELKADRHIGRLPLEEYVSRGLYVADPPVAYVRIRLDPHAKAAVTVIRPAIEHRILRREQIEDVGSLRTIREASANFRRVAERRTGA